MCVWRRLGVRHKRLGVVKGVGRRASPWRLKNMGPHYTTSQKKIAYELREVVPGGASSDVDIFFFPKLSQF